MSTTAKYFCPILHHLKIPRYDSRGGGIWGLIKTTDYIRHNNNSGGWHFSSFHGAKRKIYGNNYIL